jgi:hypothetical protein
LGCADYAGRGSYWGPWVLAAVIVGWTAMMLALTWWARRRNLVGHDGMALRLTLGWMVGVSGILGFLLLRSIVNTSAVSQAPYCNSYAHMWLTFSWLLLPLPAGCLGGIVYVRYAVARPSRAGRDGRRPGSPEDI